MDTVKAVINLKEGTVQLEGPQEFVEKYLDKYDSIVTNWKTVSPLSPKKEEEGEIEEPIPKRTRTVRPKTGPPCGEKTRELISAGFFKEQRTSTDVQQQLLEKGNRYDVSLVSATLNNLFRAGKLERTGVGRGAKYYSNV